MPITYSIDQGRQLILSEGFGTVKADELCIYYSGMADDPELFQGYNILCDLRKVEKFDLNFESIFMVVQETRRSRTGKKIGRVAFLANNSTQFGIANMYAAMGLLYEEVFNVFREEKAALEWLARG